MKLSQLSTASNKKAEKQKEQTVVDLFCGAGGLSYGFQQAGFKVLYGVDKEPIALQTFEKNHEGSQALNLDLSKQESIEFIISEVNKQTSSLDVLMGGPPCQGFSLAGPRKENDDRNVLYQAMVKIAERLKPKCVILENVLGLVSLYEGKAAKQIISDFKALGYNTMKFKELFGPNYRIPQIRKRVFFVGVFGDIEFPFPIPVISDSNDFVTCEQAIGDLPPLDGIVGEKEQEYIHPPFSDYQRLMRQNSTTIYNHEGTIHIPKTVKMIALVPEGKNYKALPPEYRKLYKYNEALTRYHSQKPSLTINTGHRSHFHYKWNRIPTVRESARLQSFPDDFVFYGPKTKQYKQVGNAVPPLFGYHLAKSVQSVLDDTEKYASIAESIHKSRMPKQLQLFGEE